jgi:hypothetical protein
MSNTELVIDQGYGVAATQQFPANNGLNAGAVAIEQERAIAEARGQMQLAKMFPRSEAAATAKLLEACKSSEFAATAFYSVPNRGSGPSIRFAEEVARVYQNFQYGHRELSRTKGKSEIEVYAWDVENNNYSKRQITVLHVRDTRDGPKPLIDQADIDNRIANVASKQMRSRILALVSKQMVADGIAACKRTIAGNNDEPISARVSKMVASFSKYFVNAEHLTKYLGHTLDSITLDEMADLIGVFNAIKDGAKPSEYFGAQEKAEAVASTAEAIKATAAAAPRKTAAAKPAPTPEPAPEPAAAAGQQESKTVTKPSNPVQEQAAQATVQRPTAPPADDGADVF